jgi:hypothetical protein
MDAVVKSRRERAREELLEPCPYQGDGSELVGKIPSEVPSEILSRYHGEKNPLKAIRARCLDCCCGLFANAQPSPAPVGHSELAQTLFDESANFSRTESRHGGEAG